MSNLLSKFEARTREPDSQPPKQQRRGRAWTDRVYKLYVPKHGWAVKPEPKSREALALLPYAEKLAREKAQERWSKQQYLLNKSKDLVGKQVPKPKQGHRGKSSLIDAPAIRSDDGQFRRIKADSERLLNNLQKFHVLLHNQVIYTKRDAPAVIYYLGVHINVTPIQRSVQIERQAAGDNRAEEAEDTDFWAAGC